MRGVKVFGGLNRCLPVATVSGAGKEDPELSPGWRTGQRLEQGAQAAGVWPVARDAKASGTGSHLRYPAAGQVLPPGKL